jgi:hypothetical protein
MNSIEDKVKTIVNNGDNIINSQFYKKYYDYIALYNDLISKGVVCKRQSQMSTILDNPNNIIIFNSRNAIVN